MIHENEQEKSVDDLIAEANEQLPVPVMEFDEQIDLGPAEVVPPAGGKASRARTKKLKGADPAGQGTLDMGE